MAKKKKDRPHAVPNRHLHARVSYLYQAAAYLQAAPIPSLTQRNKTSTGEATAEADRTASPTSHLGDERMLLSQIRPITQKGKIQVSPDIKRGICKRCSSLLIPGSTCTASIENTSRRARKPWADVLVVTCTTCKAPKRFPVGCVQQPQRKDRELNSQSRGAERSDSTKKRGHDRKSGRI